MKIEAALIAAVAGHGRLMEPPGRSSLRFHQSDPAVSEGWSRITHNYNDNQLFCGGLSVQIDNDYKCGVCGDNYADQRPRENELGGTYGKAMIFPRAYQTSQVIDVVVQVTAHHQGWFEFKLCKQDAAYEDEDCFSSNDSLLSFEDGTTRHFITDDFPTRPGKGGYWYDMRVQLPENLDCQHCVLQWHYHTGNSWGVDEDGSGLGHGNQEEFYGCADVIIGDYDPPASIAPPSQPPVTNDPPASNGPDDNGADSTPPASGGDGGFCDGKDNGTYTHPECSKFYHCAHGITHEKDCPPGLLWNGDVGVCDWPYNVTCN